MQLASAPRESSGQNGRASMAVQAAPAPAGDFRQLADHGFCQRDNKQNNIIILHRTTSAKTRATVRQLADQLHIPPNVVVNCMSTNYERTKWVKNCNFVKSSNMSTVELRHTIIEKLSQIEDASFLRAIKTIVESKANEDVYKLSDFQKKRIKESREQVKLGQTISNDALQKEIREWLGTR